MPLTYVVIVLIIVGVLLWLINRFIPMAASIKTILNVVVVIVVILWVLSAFGIVTGLPHINLK
jgi:membrane-bound ClpP family serine protease